MIFGAELVVAKTMEDLIARYKFDTIWKINVSGSIHIEDMEKDLVPN